MKTSKLFYLPISRSKTGTASVWRNSETKSGMGRKPFCYLFFSWVMTGVMVGSFGMAKILSWQMESTTVQIASPSGWTMEEISRFREEEEANEENEAFFSFTAWKETKKGIVENEGVKREVEAPVFEIDGDSNLLFPDGISYETILKKGDKEGCLVGKNTAEQLFGGHKIIGCELVCQGRALTVRGVLGQIEDGVVCQGQDVGNTPQDISKSGGLSSLSSGIFPGAENAVSSQSRQGNGVLFDRISLKVLGNAEKKQAAEEFMVRHGIDGISLPLDWFENISGAICLILPIFLFCSIWKQYGGLAVKYRAYPVLSAVLFAGAAALSVGYILLLDFDILFPASMVPTRWSDFEFWGQWADGQKERYAVFVEASKSALETRGAGLCMQAAVCGLCAVFAMPFSVLREAGTGKREEKAGGILGVWILTLAVFFFLISCNRGSGQALAENKGLWFSFAYYMAVQMLKGRMAHAFEAAGFW